MRSEFKVNFKKIKTFRGRDKSRLHREPAIRQLLILAHQLRSTLKENPKRTLKEIAGWIGYTPARMSQIMGLLFLSPYIQEEIILSNETFIYKLSVNEIHLITKSLLWDEQNKQWLQFSDKGR